MIHEWSLRNTPFWSLCGPIPKGFIGARLHREFNNIPVASRHISARDSAQDANSFVNAPYLPKTIEVAYITRKEGVEAGGILRRRR